MNADELAPALRACLTSDPSAVAAQIRRFALDFAGTVVDLDPELERAGLAILLGAEGPRQEAANEPMDRS